MTRRRAPVSLMKLSRFGLPLRAGAHGCLHGQPDAPLGTLGRVDGVAARFADDEHVDVVRSAAWFTAVAGRRRSEEQHRLGAVGAGELLGDDRRRAGVGEDQSANGAVQRVGMVGPHEARRVHLLGRDDAGLLRPVDLALDGGHARPRPPRYVGEAVAGVRIDQYPREDPAVSGGPEDRGEGGRSFHKS